MVQGNIHGADAYYLTEVKFESPSIIDGASIDLSRVTTDIEIFENLDRPYLTGYIVFADTVGFSDQINIRGGESITISFRRRDSDFTITKKFRVRRTERSIKANSDNGEIISLSLIDDCMFTSEAQSISKSYKGTSYTIIRDIALQYLDKRIRRSKPVREEGIKTIIPNLSPLNAIDFIKARASTDLGLPFFVYSNLVSDDLQFMDLGTMIGRETSFKHPFVHAQTRRDMTMSDSLIKDIFTIRGYDIKRQDDLYSIMQAGHIGSTNRFYDTFTMKSTDIKFDIINDIFKPLLDRDIIRKEQKKFLYDQNLEFKGEKLHKRSSITQTRIHSSGLYNDGINSSKSIDEEFLPSDYNKRVVGEVIQNVLRKNPITIVVPAHAFIEGDVHQTIGNVIDLRFMDNQMDKKGASAGIDVKKSGQYLIHNCKHMLKKEKYEIVMTCLKLADMEKLA